MTELGHTFLHMNWLAPADPAPNHLLVWDGQTELCFRRFYTSLIYIYRTEKPGRRWTHREYVGLTVGEEKNGMIPTFSPYRLWELTRYEIIHKGFGVSECISLMYAWEMGRCSIGFLVSLSQNCKLSLFLCKILWWWWWWMVGNQWGSEDVRTVLERSGGGESGHAHPWVAGDKLLLHQRRRHRLLVPGALPGAGGPPPSPPGGQRTGRPRPPRRRRHRLHPALPGSTLRPVPSRRPPSRQRRLRFAFLLGQPPSCSPLFAPFWLASFFILMQVVVCFLPSL